MILKDRARNDNSFFNKGHFSGSGSGKVNKKDCEPCRRFNKGRCTYGLACKYDHRCSVKRYGKFGHGAHVCRVRIQQEQGSNSTDSSGPANPAPANNNN